MCGKSDIPQARNTFHHYSGNGKVLDSGYDVSTANTTALLWKFPYIPGANARRLIAAEYQILVSSHTLGIWFLGVYSGKYHPFSPYF